MRIWRVLHKDADEEAAPQVSFQPAAQPTTRRHVHHLCFSPDSTLVAWAQYDWAIGDGTVHVWDLENGREIPGLGSRLFGNAVHSLAFFPDSERLIFLNEDRFVEVWDTTEGKTKASFAAVGKNDGAGGTSTAHVKLSPCGRWLAASSISGQGLDLWDIKSQKLVMALPAESGNVWCIAWSPDGRLLAVSTSSGGLAIWDLREIRSQLDELGLDWCDHPTGRRANAAVSLR
jgi:WD40 repeat protein